MQQPHRRISLAPFLRPSYGRPDHSRGTPAAAGWTAPPPLVVTDEKTFKAHAKISSATGGKTPRGASKRCTIQVPSSCLRSLKTGDTRPSVRYTFFCHCGDGQAHTERKRLPLTLLFFACRRSIRSSVPGGSSSGFQRYWVRGWFGG